MSLTEFKTFWEGLNNEPSIESETLEVFYHQEIYMEEFI